MVVSRVSHSLRMESGKYNRNPIITKLLDPKEESIFDRYYEVLVPVLSIMDLIYLRKQVIEESRIRVDIFNLVDLGLLHYCIPQEINFPEFVKWCAIQYLES